jgi:hypothetical protein
MPVASPEFQQPPGISVLWRQAGNGIGGFSGGLPFTSHFPFQLAYLAHLGPLEIVHQNIRSPQASGFLSSSMLALVFNLVKYFSKGRLGEQQGDVRLEGRLIILDHPEVVALLLYHLPG